MGEVRLYQRSQLPPSRVGMVKSPDIPEISTVEAVAEIGGDILGKVWEAQAANEQSEYLGFISTTLEEINTAVADNPNMSPDELKKLKKVAFKKFDAAASSAVMPRTKQFIKNFNSKNRELLEQKMDTQVAELKTRQELERFKVNRINAKARRDMPGLEKLYDGQVAAGLMDAEVSAIAYKNDVLEDDALQVIEDEEKARIERMQMLEQFAEAGRDMELAEATTFFNEISREIISETERNGLVAQRKRQEQIVTATTNRKVRWDVLRKVTENPQSITDEYLESLVKPNSLTWDDAEEFKKIRDDKDDPLKTPGAQLYMKTLDVLYPDVLKPEEKTTADRIEEYDRRNIQLRNWLEKNPDATPEQRRKFFGELTEDIVKDLDLWQWFGKLLRPKETTPFWRHFGTTEEAALARKKAPEPKTIEEFNETVSNIEDDEKAKAYYEKWKDKW